MVRERSEIEDTTAVPPAALKEMEEKIRTSEEAAKGADEAVKAARETAEATNKEAQAAENAARARIEGVKAAMLQRIEALEKKLNSLEDSIPKERVVILREVSKEEAEKEILELFSQGQTLYYSDIAEQLGLDLKLVVEVCNELHSRGEIEVVDDTLQRR